MRISKDGIWRATRTPLGPAVEHLVQMRTHVEARAWGPGASWLVDHLPTLLGEHDDDSDFPQTGLLGEINRKTVGLRIPRSEAVWESLVPAILEQKVTGIEARDSFARLHRTLSESAPSPPDGPRLLLPLDPTVVAGTPGHAFMKCNVERKRSDTIRRCASYSRRLEEAVAMDVDAARNRLLALPGVGAWTAAEVGIRALGDADAVSVGDYHVKNWVAWNLAGKARGTDDEMLELLEPYRPHRGRAVLLIQLGGTAPPKYGARMSIQKRW